MPIEPGSTDNPLEMAPIDWSMHQSDEDDEESNLVDIPPFPPYAYASVRRAIEAGNWNPVYLPDDGFPRERPADIRREIEDGELEIVSVEVTEED
jgi:hypothetical protein